jgi:hypothetical protein
VIKNDLELQATQQRIEYFYRIVAQLRATETNPVNYRSAVGGFLAEIGRMNLEVREYLSLHPSEMKDETELVEA